jgi:hypothetical protein
MEEPMIRPVSGPDYSSQNSSNASDVKQAMTAIKSKINVVCDFMMQGEFLKYDFLPGFYDFFHALQKGLPSTQADQMKTLIDNYMTEGDGPIIDKQKEGLPITSQDITNLKDSLTPLLKFITSDEFADSVNLKKAMTAELGRLDELVDGGPEFDNQLTGFKMVFTHLAEINSLMKGDYKLDYQGLDYYLAQYSSSPDEDLKESVHTAIQALLQDLQ